MSSIYIQGGTLINEGEICKANILVEDGRIKSISKGEMVGSFDTILDASGMLILPGIIDDQVHFREPGLTSKGTIGTESKAAVAGGITSFMEMPNTIPPTTNQERISEKLAIAKQHAWCNYSFYLGATNNNLSDIRGIDPSKICGVKVFMGSSTGNLLVDQDQALHNIFTYAQVPVAVHSEDEGTIRNNMDRFALEYGNNPPPSVHPKIRSREACVICTLRAIEYARRTGGHLHLLHLSTQEEVQLIRQAKEEGINITAEVCVHHLLFSEKDYAERGNWIKWNPAIKEEEDRLALIQGLKMGVLDMVATDHAPHESEKKSGGYFSAPSGGPMVQHSLLVMLELASQGYFSKTDVVQWMAHNPAQCFNISHRGFLREGFYADLVFVQEHVPWKVVGKESEYHCKWSPIEGMLLNHKVISTMVNGSLVYHKGNFLEMNRNPMELVFQRGRG